MNLLTTFNVGASATYYVDMYVAVTGNLKLFFEATGFTGIASVELLQGMGTPYDDLVPYPWISAVPFAGQPASHPTTQPVWELEGDSYTPSSVVSSRQTLTIWVDRQKTDSWLSAKVTGGNVLSTVNLYVEAP